LSRTMCASLTCTEMVSAKGLAYRDKKTERLLRTADTEHPCAAQIFGSDPNAIREAAGIALSLSGAEILDLNMGCPTPKIVTNGDGSALMRDLPLAARVISAAVEGAGAVPVTIKMRIGWDAGHINAVEFAKMAQDSGAAALCVHGRTRTQMYAGRADWACIAAVKRAVTIPVTANGDVFSPEDAVSILGETGADMCMIGRGALGNPWIFVQAEAAIGGRPVPPMPSVSERIATAERQLLLACEDKGEHIAMLEARKHLIWYLKGLRSVSDYKEQISRICAVSDMREIVCKIQDDDAKGRWHS